MADVLYVPELARKLGRTEAAIRAAVHRGSRSVPPPFKIGRKHAWRPESVDAWLDGREAEALGVDQLGGRDA